MQTILGAGGAIANELAKALTAYTHNIKLVSRNPEKVNAGDILIPADLTQYEEVLDAVKGSEVVYLTAGLPYNTRIWKSSWPLIMKNVINACLEHTCKLVFFDNMYMYDGRRLDPITEESPVNPPSKKGRVRAEIAHMLLTATRESELQALIARCADYYGPGIKQNSLLTETVFKPLSKGSTANWLMSDTYKHAFTFTPDAGRATAILGNTPEAYGQVWHLPTAPNPMSGKQWIEAIAAQLGVRPRYRTVSKSMVRLLGLFIPVMKESIEMLYQYDRDYVFSSAKFEQHFNFQPTPYQEGIRQIVQNDYRGS